MGPNYSISTACATSNFCILNAANHIIRGEAVSVFSFSHLNVPSVSLRYSEYDVKLSTTVLLQYLLKFIE